MDNILEIIGAALGGLLLIGLVAVLGGTLVFWFWPHFIGDVLPGLVASGAVAGTIAWWKAVLFTWTCGILFKGGSSSSSSK